MRPQRYSIISVFELVTIQKAYPDHVSALTNVCSQVKDFKSPSLSFFIYKIVEIICFTRIAKGTVLDPFGKLLSRVLSWCMVSVRK